MYRNLGFRVLGLIDLRFRVKGLRLRLSIWVQAGRFLRGTSVDPWDHEGNRHSSPKGTVAQTLLLESPMPLN